MSRRFSALLAATVLSVAQLWAADYYVATTGSDTNPGTLAQPFATIQHAADTMGAGDTCYIRSGNYHEAVVISGLAGTLGSPVTFTSYNNEVVTLNGSQSITDLGSTGWTQHSGNIYKTTLNTDIWQLYVDGELMIPARWPNANFDDGSIWDWANKWARADSTASSNGTLIDQPHANADLAASGLDMTGAMAILNVGSFKTWTRAVNSHSAGSGTFTYNAATSYVTKEHHYFVEGKLNLLDVEKEWFYDTATKTLYLWTPGGGAPTGDIRGKTQSYAFDVTLSTYLNLKNLDFFGTTFKFYNSENITVEGCDLLYPSCSKRMLGSIAAPEASTIEQPQKIHASNSTVKDCSFAFAESHAIYMKGDGDRIENCYFSNIDWVVSELPGLMGSIYMEGPNNVFSHNTVDTAGASELLDLGDAPVVEYNELLNYGLVQSDGSGVQITIGAQPNSITRYNWIHDNLKYGARFDAPNPPTSWGSNGLMHHNVGWNCKAALMVKGEFHECYNNTAFNNSPNNDIIILDDSADGGGANNGTITRNNTANKISGDRSNPVSVPGTQDHNWNGYDTLQDIRTQLRDPDNWDFRPIAGSSVIDGGLAVAGITDGYLGTAPDMGAYEDGAANYWIAGCRFDNAVTPVPPNGNNAVKLDADLMWLEGKDATSHKIYFGTNPGSLVYQGEQTSNIFDPGALAVDTIYYWRVDEVTPLGTITGDVWNFDTTDPSGAPGTNDVVAVADTIVNSNVPTGTSNGTYMKVKDKSVDFQGLVKFDVALGGNTLQSATLKLTAYDATRPIVNPGIYACADNTWQEGVVTWNTRPTMGSLIASKSGTFNAVQTLEFDVTSYITGDGTFSFYVWNVGSAAEGRYATKENGTYAGPTLTIVTSGGGPVNNPPTFNSNPVVEVNATEDAAYSSTLADNASDLDSDPLTFSTISGPAWLGVASSGALSGTPVNADVGLNSWMIQVTDGTDSDTATLEITVDNVNDAPTFTVDPINKPNGLENAAYSDTIAGSATDVDVGDTLTYSKVSGPAWLSVAANGALSGTPGAGDVGANVFTVKVEDAALASATATLNITVDQANQPPAFTSNPITEIDANEGVAYSSTIADNASDPESDPMTFSKVSGPAWLSVASNGALSGTPGAGDVGANAFTVQVDATGGSDTATLNISVIAAPVNQPPAFTVNPFSKANATENAAYSASIATDASDPESDPLTFSKVSGPAWLSMASDGTLSGTPGAGDVGANAFTVQVDATGGSDTATLNITVDAAGGSWVDLTYDDFEAGWGNYQDGGSDCRRNSKDSSHAHQGTYCARIRDNTSTSIFDYSTGVDVNGPGYTQIKIDFWYKPRSMETGEDFWVQYWDGSTWQTVASYVSGTDFSNNSFYHITDIIIDEASYTFPSDMKIRFRCDASGNSDYVYIDEVRVSAK